MATTKAKKTVPPAAKKVATKATDGAAASTTKKAPTVAPAKAGRKPAGGTAKKAKKTVGKLLLPIRMSHEADLLLRTTEKAYRIGNLTKRVLAAIDGVNLDKVKVEDRPRTPYMRKDYAITTIRLPKEVKKSLSDIAEARGTSMSALIDGAVRQFYKEKKRP